MAGRRRFLTLLTGIGTGWLAAAAVAQPPPPEQGPKPEPPRRFFHHPSPDGDAMRDRAMRDLQKLSPEKRADLWRAVWTVLNLPPEKRQTLLGMDDERRKVAREEIDRAIGENGLQLDEERRKAFVRRYFDERHAIEEKLRKEADEKRRQLLGEMRERLKKEFGTPPAIPAGTDGAK
jgi:hypothetical protein